MYCSCVHYHEEDCCDAYSALQQCLLNAIEGIKLWFEEMTDVFVASFRFTKQNVTEM